MHRTQWAVAAALALLTACAQETTAPRASDPEGVDLVQDLASTGTSAIDRAGIGGVEFPDSIKLSVEQKAQIAALHAAYKTATQADVDALKKIEAEVAAAKKAGKTREEIATILAKAAPILARLQAAFAKLQADIWKVYTPAQQAWLRSRGPIECRGDSIKGLSEAQVKKIRELKAAFEASVKDELEVIRKVHEEAQAARKAGKSEAEIKSIWAKAEPALKELRAQEAKLKQAILAVLTPEQRNNPCILRGLGK